MNEDDFIFDDDDDVFVNQTPIEEQSSNEDDFIKEDIQAKINFYFPNISLDSVEILENIDFNSINVVMLLHLFL